MTVIPLLLFGCSEVRLQGKQGHKDHPDDPSDREVEEPTLDGPRAFDPLFGPATLSLRDAPEERTVEVVITTRAGDSVLRYTTETDSAGALQITWDGRTEAGEWTEAGPYIIAVSEDSFELQSEIVAVRAGAIEARLEGDGGVSAVREPLYWPIERELQSEGEEISKIEAIDDGEQPIDFPSAALSGPTRPSGLTRAEPAAFVFDSRPLLSLTIAEESALGGTGLDDIDVDLSVEGFSVLSGNPLRPGGLVLLQRDEPLGETVGVSSLDLVLSFSALGDPLGEQHLPLQIYRLLDVSQFEDDDDIYRPWVPVVDEALAAIEGTAADPLPVLDALDAFVYYDLGLVYSVVVGDGGAVNVTMTLTAPACPVAGTLPGEVERVVRSVDGVSEAKVDLVWDPPWNPGMMSKMARVMLGM